jgi:hypothetical protein
LDAVYDLKYRSFSIGPTQIHSEIALLLGFFDRSPRRSVLEIGTGLERTIIVFQVASQDAILIEGSDEAWSTERGAGLCRNGYLGIGY